MFGLFAKRSDKPFQPGHPLTVRLNALVQPIDRGRYFEDPLDSALEARGLGRVVGGGTQRAADPYGIAFVEIALRVRDLEDETLCFVTNTLDKVGAPKGSRLVVPGRRDMAFGHLEGMGLFLKAPERRGEACATADVSEIIQDLDRLAGDTGNFRSYWQGAKGTALYFYGTSFQEMAARVQDYLMTEPAVARARVEQLA